MLKVEAFLTAAKEEKERRTREIGSLTERNKEVKLIAIIGTSY